jgi:two-component system cell cycle response regulator CtrA
MLELAGFTVYVTGFGEDALDLARAYRFDVVVLDLTMPELSGWETLQELQQLDPAVTVLLMSGYAPEAATETHGAAAGFLPKPYSAAELRDAVGALIG